MVECIAEAILRCGFTTDPHLSNVVLLLGGEDVNGSIGAPGFTDESPAAHGTAFITNPAYIYISTDQSRYGRSSVRCFNRGPLFGGSEDWHLSSANSDQFTVECSAYFNSLPSPSPGVLIAQWHAFSSSMGWAFYTDGSEFVFALSTSGVAFDVVVTSSGAALGTGTWYSLAVDKDSSGKIRLYENGAMIGSATPANSAMFNITNALTLGMTEFVGGLSDCWLDEVRITKGVARYASNSGYAVSSSAFPRA